MNYVFMTRAAIESPLHINSFSICVLASNLWFSSRSYSPDLGNAYLVDLIQEKFGSRRQFYVGGISAFVDFFLEKDGFPSDDRKAGTDVFS